MKNEQDLFLLQLNHS